MWSHSVFSEITMKGDRLKNKRSDYRDPTFTSVLPALLMESFSGLLSNLVVIFATLLSPSPVSPRVCISTTGRLWRFHRGVAQRDKQGPRSISSFFFYPFFFSGTKWTWRQERRVAFSSLSSSSCVTSRGQSVLWSHVFSRFWRFAHPWTSGCSSLIQSAPSFCTFLLPLTHILHRQRLNVEGVQRGTTCGSTPGLSLASARVWPCFRRVWWRRDQGRSRDATALREDRSRQSSVVPQQRPHQFLTGTFLHDSKLS